jgi:hypothetical protein
MPTPEGNITSSETWTVKIEDQELPTAVEEEQEDDLPKL